MAKGSNRPADGDAVVAPKPIRRGRNRLISGASALNLALVVALLCAGCTSAATAESGEPGESGESGEPTILADQVDAQTHYFETLPPGSTLPDGAECAEKVLADPSIEIRPENDGPNSTVVPATEFGTMRIDGADEFWNAELAPRIDGNFTGTTEQILRWGACKWGFDENVTRARAVTESSWFMSTEGDSTEDPGACALLGLDAPCPQSYGLLQVKGTVHTGTYPFSTQSSAFGVDYAMAWLRACFEGSFTWLVETEFERVDGYQAGEEYGCVGTWFSGEWWDQPANDYVGEVRYHVENQSWLKY